MKIVLLSTGRGLRPEFIQELRANLGLHDSDELSLVAWQRSGVPLPVSRHLVMGPHLRAGGRATDQGVQQHALIPAPLEETPAVGGPEPDAAGSDATLSDTPLSDTPLSDTPLSDTPLSDTAGSDAPLSDADPLKKESQPPALHPRRVVRAVAWRARRLKKGLTRRARRLRKASGLTAIRRHPKFRRVRGRLSPGISLGFAGNCLQARAVHDMMRDADLVIALDTASHRGAWTLAQKVPGPDVVIGLAAAKRLLEQRQLSALNDADLLRPSGSAS